MNRILNETNEEKRAVERWENEGGLWRIADSIDPLKDETFRLTAR